MMTTADIQTISELLKTLHKIQDASDDRFFHYKQTMDETEKVYQIVHAACCRLTALLIADWQ